MTIEPYDAIIIGTGQSGPALAHRFAKAGKRVAIIERKRFGGTCVNNGCIPTKALIASARAAHVARRAAEFGVMIDGAVRVDMKAVKARKDAIVKVSNEGVEEGLREDPNITVYVAHATSSRPSRWRPARRRSRRNRSSSTWAAVPTCRPFRASTPCRISPIPR
jgi:pyruvate/2-oxoglutarate dehydrogenase complex dihydrolipoamide dehydrogenase (E3) component